MISDVNGNQQYWGNTPSPIGPMLKADFPEIKNTARVNFKNILIKQGDNVFRENVSFIDTSFYDMFDFPIKWGNKKNFADPNGIVLTNELSEKLFGRENAVGETLNIRFNHNNQEIIENFTVKGVLDKRPAETSFYFSALIPYQKMSSLGLDKTGDWSQSSDITFVETDNQTELSTKRGQYKKYLNLYNEANPDNKISSFHFQPLNGMKFHAYMVNNQRFNATRPVGLIMLLVISVSILLLVCFNYMNIAIAGASRRLKEIGIRKVMGSARKQIIFQFLVENLILCAIAVLIGLVLARFVFLPWFSQFANIELGQRLFTNYRTWLALFILIIVSALGGAAYPSFYISTFNPINILKGKNSMGSTNRFRKALLGFQFLLTFLAISTAIAFIQETKRIKARPWGYDPLNTMVINLDKNGNFNLFNSELKSNNKIKSVSASVQALGNFSKQALVKSEGRELTTQCLNVLPGFISKSGINILKGRDLSEEFKTDQSASVLVNQAFLKQMNWFTGIGKTIEYDRRKYSIVGEINDFHYENFESPVGPMLIFGCKPEEVKYIYIKTKESIFANAQSGIELVWKKINSNQPFEFYYQEDVFDDYFNGFKQISQILSATSFIMIVISITGIFGLALLILGKKMKEMSVRKVLGAGIGNISFLINREFLFAIGFASLFGFPLSYWISRSLFNQISPESKVSFIPLILTFLILIIMTLMSVVWHIFKAYTLNPTSFLREE
jgi:ABC-type antimicrobial peptide transport system permease subunit